MRDNRGYWGRTGQDRDLCRSELSDDGSGSARCRSLTSVSGLLLELPQETSEGRGSTAVVSPAHKVGTMCPGHDGKSRVGSQSLEHGPGRPSLLPALPHAGQTGVPSMSSRCSAMGGGRFSYAAGRRSKGRWSRQTRQATRASLLASARSESLLIDRLHGDECRSPRCGPLRGGPLHPIGRSCCRPGSDSRHRGAEARPDDPSPRAHGPRSVPSRTPPSGRRRAHARRRTCENCCATDGASRGPYLAYAIPRLQTRTLPDRQQPA